MRWGNRLPIMFFALMLPLSSVAATYAGLFVTANEPAKASLGASQVVCETETGYKVIGNDVLSIDSFQSHMPNWAAGECEVAVNLTIKPNGMDAIEDMGNHASFILSGSLNSVASYAYCYLEYGGVAFNPYRRSSSSNQIAGLFYVYDMLTQVDYDRNSLNSLVKYSGINDIFNPISFRCVFRFDFPTGYQIPSPGTLSFTLRIEQ